MCYFVIFTYTNNKSWMMIILGSFLPDVSRKFEVGIRDESDTRKRTEHPYRNTPRDGQCGDQALIQKPGNQFDRVKLDKIR